MEAEDPSAIIPTAILKIKMIRPPITKTFSLAEEVRLDHDRPLVALAERVAEARGRRDNPYPSCRRIKIIPSIVDYVDLLLLTTVVRSYN